MSSITRGQGWTLDWFGDEIEASLVGHLPDMSRKGAEHILTVANRTAPIDTGAMIEHSAVGEDTGGKVSESVIAYSAPYALRQHEDLSYRHKPGRRAKWLELTIEEEGDATIEIMSDELSRYFGS